MEKSIRYEVKSSLGTFDIFLKSTWRHVDAYVLYHEFNEQYRLLNKPVFSLKHEHLFGYDLKEVKVSCKEWVRVYLKSKGVNFFKFTLKS